MDACGTGAIQIIPLPGKIFSVQSAKTQPILSLKHFQKRPWHGQKATLFSVPKSRIHGGISNSL
jgi:hypothetical protein